MVDELATIVWLRHDLRVGDNPALQHAIHAGGPVVPLFVHAPREQLPWQPGAASNWWLHHSLAALDENLQAKGSRLIVRQGETLAELRQVVHQTKANQVVWNRCHEPAIAERDQKIAAALQADGCHVSTFEGNLLVDPGQPRTKQGKPFQVFTPFWKYISKILTEIQPPLPTPRTLAAPARWPASTKLPELKLLPQIDWAAGFRKAWQPGEVGAKQQLAAFARQHVDQYDSGRNLPGQDLTSRLSPHLHFGEISPRQVWHTIIEGQHAGHRGISESAEIYLKELGWREFAHHLLVHFPQTTDAPLREEFAGFAWRSSAKDLHAWQRGQTGYPLVDAGMRQLWHTGWMHNRVRMIVASFLCKHLLLPWQDGARWFWDTLVDADLANNTLGWQWTAGCGADAAPYFRVFNPISQAAKFDPQGAYIRRWVPEIAALADRWLGSPWEASSAELRAAKIEIGKTYPAPIVDHAAGRTRALQAWKQMRGK